MNDVLLTVSGVIQDNMGDQILQGKRPMTDYFAMARAFQADLIDYAEARKMTGSFGKFLEYIGGPNLTLAWACFLQRKRYKVIFTDGEQVGIPLAGLLKFFGGKERPRHLMIVHILSVGKKMFFFDWLGVQSHIDQFFVYSTWQKQFIEHRWKIPTERVTFTHFMVDTRFFSPEATENQPPFTIPGSSKPILCSVGLEFRDYPTLIEAARGLDVDVVIAAASPWSKRKDTTAQQEIPPNVHVRKFTQYELRGVYNASRFLVMPLYPVNFQAGVTAILEAMAMERAVVCSRTPGQTDVIVEGETGRYVPPGDVDALRATIQYLLDHPEEAESMGKRARQRVLQEMSLDCYTQRLSQYVK